MCDMEGWRKTKIKAEFYLGRGRVISQNEIENTIGNYPVYSSQSTNKGEMGKINTFDFDGEYITWTTDGAYAGTVFYRNGKFNCTNVCGTLKAIDESKTDHLFVAYLLSTISKNYVSYVGNPKLMNGVMAEIPFSVPCFLSEQKRIAQIITTIDNTIEKTEQLIAKYKNIKQGLMHDLLMYGIDENGKIRSDTTHSLKKTKYGKIPQEWSLEKLGNLILAIDPQPDHRTPPACDDGFPYLGISDFLENGDVDLINCRKVSHNVLLKQNSSFSIDKGDLIFGKIGTIGQVKRLPDYHKQNFSLSANVILIKPLECSDFIYWSLLAKYVEIQVNATIHSTTQPAFGMEKIRNLDIITPPIEERERIVKYLNSFDKNIKFEVEYYSKLLNVKQGLMADLLTGKVRVKTDIEIKD